MFHFGASFFIINTMKNQFTIVRDGVTTIIPFELVKTRRKTVGIIISPGGRVVIRAPLYSTREGLEKFLIERQDWIYENYCMQREKPDLESMKQNERKDPRLQYLVKKYKKKAKSYIYERVEYYRTMTGGSYRTIRIGDPKTRWGSCSSNGTLSFSWRLMLAPPRVLDYVVIHELCHLTYMDHSREFWEKVASIDPDYKEHKKWLKENEEKLILK